MKKEENIIKKIYVLKSTLLSRIDAQTGLVARVRKDKDGLANNDLRTDGKDYRFLINDWIDTYLKKAKARMAAYVVNPSSDSQMDYSKGWEEAVIDLSFPWYWNETTFENLANAINEYIINSVLFEFYSLTLSPSDPLVQGKQIQADDAYNSIKHYCLTSIPHAIKKTPYPY